MDSYWCSYIQIFVNDAQKRESSMLLEFLSSNLGETGKFLELVKRRQVFGAIVNRPRFSESGRELARIW